MWHEDFSTRAGHNIWQIVSNLDCDQVLLIVPVILSAGWTGLCCHKFQLVSLSLTFLLSGDLVRALVWVYLKMRRYPTACHSKRDGLTSVSPVYNVYPPVQQSAASLLNPVFYCCSDPVLSEWTDLIWELWLDHSNSSRLIHSQTTWSQNNENTLDQHQHYTSTTQ